MKTDKNDLITGVSGIENQLVTRVDDISSNTFSLLESRYCANCVYSNFPNTLIDFGLQSNIGNLFGEDAAAATFPGIGVGAIPDATVTGPQIPGTPLNITFNVTGISGAPTNVEVNMTGTHSYVGDLKATLFAPNGSSFTIFGYTGATATTSFGSGADLAGTYNFKDSAAGTNWWTAAVNTPVPVGDYRTTVSGPTTNPAAVTNLTAAFAGVTNPNGTWTLRLTDGASTDTGSITAANLTLTGAPVVAPANDNFINAAPLLDYPHFDGPYWSGSEGEATGRNTAATIEAGEPVHAGVPGGKSVWFKLRPEEFNSTYVFTTNGSDFDTTFAIYTGTSLNNLTLIASNDDLAPFQTSSVAFQAVAGTVYYIAVDGKQGASGNIKLTWATKPGFPSTFYGTLTDEFYNYYPSGVNLGPTTINVDCSTGRYTATTFGDQNTFFSLNPFPANALNCRLAGSTEVFPLRLESTRIPFPQTPTYQITGTINTGNAADTKVIIAGFNKQRNCTVSQITGGGVNYTCSGIGRYSSPTISVSNPTLDYTPSSRSYSNVQSNFSSQNFTATSATSFDVSGKVLNTSGQSDSGIPISVTGTATDTVYTYSGGFYYDSLLSGNYTVTPSGTYNSVPLNYVFNSLNSDQTDKNFTVAVKNDSFANAIDITNVVNPILGYVNGATWETNEPPHADQPARRSIWYKWTAPSSNSFTFSTANSNFDTVIGVYTGSNVGSLSQVAAGDDVDTNDRTSRATFLATAGTTYSIAVDAKDFYLGKGTRSVSLKVTKNSTISGGISNVNGRTLNFNVTLDVSCVNGFSTSFNISGNYSILLPQDAGNCTLTPSGGGVNLWAPSNRTIAASQDQSGIDFTPQTPSYNVIGTLNNLPNTTNVSVSVALAGSSSRSCSFNTTTRVYQCVSLTIYGDYTITPTQPGSIFDPSTREYFAITGNFTSQDYNASLSNNPVPAIGSISPTAAAAGGAAFTLTVNGTNFVNGSIVRWNGQDRTTAYVSATQLTAQIPATDIQTAGTNQVSVFNPAPGGGTSPTSIPFTVNNPTPVMTTISPTGLTVGSTSGFQLIVNGSNFVNGSIVRWNGQDRATTFVSATQVRAQIIASDLQTAGVFPVTVFNPTPGGGVSNAVNFTLNNPVPSISSLSPASQPPGATAFELTVNGSGFVNNSIVRWNGQNRTTTFVSATQIKAQITAIDIQAAGTFPVTVVNAAPGGGTSSPVNFTVANTNVSVTIQTNPAGLSIIVDGTTYTSPQPFSNWVSGSTHTIAVTSPQGNSSTRYVWSNWSDGGAASHTVAPTSNTTYTANFTTEHFMTMTSGTGGTVSPPSGWFPAGAQVQINAVPNTGYRFNGWTGTYTGTNNPATVTITAPVSQTASFAPITAARALYDFDGDNKTDIAIFRPAVGEWWINRSSSGQTVAARFGTSTDKIVPGDFTSDGKTDIAFFRPSTGEWFVLRSQDSSFFLFPFGTNGDVPVVGDFDGDGTADAGVFRPSTNEWFIRKSSGGTIITTFGTSGDVPVAADYDGDGKCDIAIYRPSNGQWWIQRSSNLSVVAAAFGTTSDKPIPADFTGDGKVDIAFWRNASREWFVLRSEDNSFYSFPFGSPGDTPVPGDYDSDGKADPAVFNNTTRTWWINRTSAGILIQDFGSPGDIPVPSAFTR
ncbi:MAG TPA: FG-GAP-like repeat-containing protein [Pyrinomonadaceae bacterium]|nr:FG-GAP-like repeat-containing protein [Pyrinomonadaceae bacterium]